ncbi:MAG: thiamine-phosphate kinase [Planctomycetota bacterium]
MRESELHRHIYDRSADLTAEFARVEVGPGDDAAVVLSESGDRILITTDQVVEGRHFEPGTEIDLIARKAIARSVSDIAAMGGRPAWGLATGLLPAGYPHADALFDAMARWARHWDCPLVGGDIAAHAEADQPLSLTVTIAGTPATGAGPLLRSGARPGDELYLTGQIGASFESGWHLRFEPRLEAGQAAARSVRAHAAIDLSDGLGRDAARVGRASGVVLELRAADLPISHRSPGWREACAEGEDYELLLALEPGTRLATEPELIGPVGLVRKPRENEPPGAVIIDPRGTAHDATDLGWDH